MTESSWRQAGILRPGEQGVRVRPIGEKVDGALPDIELDALSFLVRGSGDGTVMLWDMSPYVTGLLATAIDASPSLPAQTAQLSEPLQ